MITIDGKVCFRGQWMTPAQYEWAVREQEKANARAYWTSFVVTFVILVTGLIVWGVL